VLSLPVATVIHWPMANGLARQLATPYKGGEAATQNDFDGIRTANPDFYDLVLM